MANLYRTEKEEVVEVVKVKDKYVLELSLDEIKAVASVLYRTGGDTKHSARKFTQGILDEIDSVFKLDPGVYEKEENYFFKADSHVFFNNENPYR